jgi:hypothetical protein
MIFTILCFDIGKKIEADFRSTYRQLLTTLRRFPGNHEWFCGENSPEQRPIPFDDEDAVLKRLHERAKLMGSKSLSAAVVNDNGTKRRPGLIEIDYISAMGYMTVSMCRPDQVQANPTQWVADIMLAVLEGEPEATFAFADVYDKVDGEFQYYKTTYATFPHRKCVGWMAYVRETVSQQQLPLAAALLPAPGGTIVVSVDQAFDLANKEHIKRANQIEMDMSDLGLLPVIDPSF